MLAIGLSWRGEGSSAHGGTSPSRITHQLMKAPERDTLSLRKRATHSLRPLSPLGESGFWSDSNQTIGPQRSGRVGRNRRFLRSVS
jgi:hypothetical protein